jgi:LPS export ABC transporter protein LptC
MTRNGLWPVIVLTLLAAGGGLWLTARRIAPHAPPKASPEPQFQVKFDRITVRGRGQGNRRWELEARSIELSKDQALTRLDGLNRATLFAGDKPQLSARAAWAQLRSPSRDMEIGGGVEVRSAEGLVLRTDRLGWRARDERLACAGPVEMSVGDTRVKAARMAYLAQPEQIVCDGGVRIRRGSDQLAGQRLRADLRAQTLEITGDVHMRLRVAEGAEFKGAQGPLGAMKGLLEKAPKEL